MSGPTAAVSRRRQPAIGFRGESVSDTRWFLLYYDVSVPDAAPAGLVRLRHRDGVERHEQLGRSGTWERTNYFLSSRRGDQTFDEVQVDAQLAAAFEDGVRPQRRGGVGWA